METAAHAARSFHTFARQDDAFLKNDFKNAFNTVRRDFLTSVFKERVPDLVPFFSLCYKEKSYLVQSSFVLSSEEGFHQGDPVPTLGFCLVLHHILIMLCSHFRTGYLDDVTSRDHWSVSWLTFC